MVENSFVTIHGGLKETKEKKNEKLIECICLSMFYISYGILEIF